MSEAYVNDAEAAISEAKSLVIDALAETMDLYGVTRSVGTLYGTMYLENDMTLDEMREELGMSKPSMSTGVKRLQEFNIVKKTFQKGTRKNTYIAEKDFFRFFENFFTKKWEREAQLNLEAISHAQARLQKVIDSNDAPNASKEKAQDIFQQFEESKPYYYWLKKLVNSIESGDLFKYIPFDDNHPYD
ncbi:choline uptake/conversion transcriptional regulator CudC [Tuberibacillus sp. Marseille-P3662]|uniref:choline uptake/conversion transcriptional regulator CudC n=1 Tax=Tuberibacillus sp. Marseille-P3662 TaxID=1965358 RepID=UPI000A1C8DF2|nr:GbsR/MarR family transcriptional regulator [Tuberibacillus sp. Marseille-P3662]